MTIKYAITDSPTPPEAKDQLTDYDDIDAAIAADRRERPMREAVASAVGKKDDKP